MALQDTPPLADPITGRIPAYTQVLKQDKNTGVYKIQYDVKATPTIDAGLTTPVTQLPGATAGMRTSAGTEDEAVSDAEEATAGANTVVSGQMGGRGNFRDRNQFTNVTSVGDQSLQDLSDMLNPNQAKSGVMAGIISMAPTLLGGLIAAGTADQQRQAVKEINRRADEGTLFKNPDGSLVTNNQLAGLQANIGTKFGIPGFRQQLNENAFKQIQTGIMGQAFQLDDNSTSIAKQYENPVSEAQFTAMMDEAMNMGRTTPQDVDAPSLDIFRNLNRTTPQDVSAPGAGIFQNLTGREATGQMPQGFVDPSPVNTNYGDAQTSTQKRKIEDKEEVKELRDQVAKQKAETARVVDLTNAVSNKARSNEVQDKNGNAVTYTDRRTGEKKAVNFGGKNKDRTTGGASREKQRQNRALGRSRGFQSGGR